MKEEIYLVPDGFYPDGKTRPWREATITKLPTHKDLWHIKYLDTNDPNDFFLANINIMTLKKKVAK
jgi:hypothetical protein